MIPLASIINNCAVALIQVLLYSLAGFSLARKKILDDSQIRAMSKITQDVLVPALTFSSFITVDRDQLLSYLPVVAIAIMMVFIGMAVGKMMGKFVIKQNSMMFQVACGFSHTLNIQLSMVGALTPLLNSLDAASNVSYQTDAQTRGTIFVILITIVNTIIRWSLLTNLIKNHEKDYRPDQSEQPEQLAANVKTPEVPLEIIVTSTPPITNQDIVLLQPNFQTEVVSQSQSQSQSCWQKIVDVFNAPLLFAMISIIVTLIPPLQELFTNETSIAYLLITKSAQVLTKSCTPVQLVLLGSNFGLSDNREEKISFKVIFSIVTAKLILMPMIGFLLILTLQGLSIMKDATMMMVIVATFAAPTSNNILTQYASLGKEMGRISKIVLATYLGSIFTFPLILVTFFSTFSTE